MHWRAEWQLLPIVMASMGVAYLVYRAAKRFGSDMPWVYAAIGLLAAIFVMSVVTDLIVS